MSPSAHAGVYDAVSTSFSWHGAPAVPGVHALDADARWAFRRAHPALYELAMSKAVTLTLAHAPLFPGDDGPRFAVLDAEMRDSPSPPHTPSDFSETTRMPVSVDIRWCVPRPPRRTCTGAPTLVEKEAMGPLVRTDTGFAIPSWDWEESEPHASASPFGSARAVLRFSREPDAARRPFVALEWTAPGGELGMLTVFKRWREEEKENGVGRGLGVEERRRLGIGLGYGEVVANWEAGRRYWEGAERERAGAGVGVRRGSSSGTSDSDGWSTASES